MRSRDAKRAGNRPNRTGLPALSALVRRRTVARSFPHAPVELVGPNVKRPGGPGHHVDDVAIAERPADGSLGEAPP